MGTTKQYFTNELKILSQRFEGTVTMEGNAPDDLEIIFYPPEGALEVNIVGTHTSLAWEYLFIEHIALRDNDTAGRLLAICDGILSGQAISKRSGNSFCRSVETTVPLRTRGFDAVWRDRSIIFFDFGRASHPDRKS